MYQHASDCPVYNMPALPVGECDCQTAVTFQCTRAVFDAISTGDIERIEDAPDEVIQRCVDIAQAVLNAKFNS